MPLKDKRVAWVEPVLVAEVEFRGWTGDGLLRHASYKGLRDAADAPRVFVGSPTRTRALSWPYLMPAAQPVSDMDDLPAK